MRSHFYATFLIIFFFPAFAKSEQFQSHPIINKKVEKFVNTFVEKLLEEELSHTNITLSEESDMSLGRIQGDFNSLVVENPNKTPSTVEGDFIFYIEPNDKNDLEYELNFETYIEISQIDNFLFLLKDFFPFCENNNSFKSYNLCSHYQASKLDTTETKLKNAIKIFKIWELYFIDLLYEIKHPEIQPIQDEFVNWIAKHILIEENSESVKMSLNFSGLRSRFNYKAPSFFRETKLIDYSLESLQIEVFEERILFNFQIKKLHVKKRINLYVDLMSQFQSFIEDETRAVVLAQSLRKDLQEREINLSSFLFQLNTKEMLNLGWAVGKNIITGSEDKNKSTQFIPSEIEEGLGLD